MYKNYLSDISYKNKRNVKKVEKAFKCESTELPRIWKIQPVVIVVKCCTGVLVNFEGIVDLVLSQLKIGTSD